MELGNPYYNVLLSDLVKFREQLSHKKPTNKRAKGKRENNDALSIFTADTPEKNEIEADFGFTIDHQPRPFKN